jgi:Secretion system C-terminal sorting domain/Regulator of chromosome condensation (RCC1) repeat
MANNWKQVSAARQFTLAIQEVGLLNGCGERNNGELGSMGPNYITMNPISGDNDWDSVSAGGAHGLGTKSSGTLWSWGLNTSGQLGIGTNAITSSIVQVGSGNDWYYASSGFLHSLALKQSGTLWAAGNNASGQLGNGANININTFTQIGTANDWKDISAGTSHSFAIKLNCGIWTWGANDYGQLGDGTFVSKNIPTLVSISLLPIKLSFFSGKTKDGKNILEWATSSEINNSRFEIEKSNDGINFEIIGTVNGLGNSSSLQYYNFTDNRVEVGFKYYRLKQIDFDGKFENSKIIMLNSLKKNKYILIYPNPSSDYLYTNSVERNTDYSILNPVGRILNVGRVIVNEPIRITHLPKGIYFIKIDGEILKFNKQ